ncbi:phosphoribosyl-ATP diphosphatase [archaeon SCG-AAA382B04]|nr:phosphoribosyl-ATP diphosphatase [archaeon SCG-AAA382B04]
METEIIEELVRVIEERKKNPPQDSYVAKLLEDRDKLLEKIGEESTEVIIASKNEEEVVHEISDLIFHLIVLSQSLDISFEKILNELRKRRN